MSPRHRSLALGLTLVVGLSVGLDAQDAAAPRPAPPAPGPGSDLFAQHGQCAVCHVDTGWDRLKEPPPGVFDHATTGFPLRGKHEGVSCERCHRQGLEGLTASCEACHHDPHSGLHMKTCERCHDERSWAVPRNLTIHESTRFPLTGAHAVVACEACHRPRRAEPAQTTPLECAVCHARNFRRAKPSHVAAGFTTCGECHSTSTFKGATYDHRVYQRTGRHASARCVQCHTGTTFAGLAAGGTDCVTCHLADYQRTPTIGNGVPDHVAQNYSTTCSQCHFNTTSFEIP